ncbi:MAG: efflux RND transporter permease subunit [Gammaproteobacteria bacterium SHHR-1]
MGFTDIFIRRPVLALVVCTLIFLLGLNALREVQLRQFPQLDKSTISIVTAYPGASAKLVQGFVTTPIQQAVAAIEGLDYISASSSQGMSQVSLYLQLGADGNVAMTEVLTSMAGIRGELPESAQSPLVTRETGSDTGLLYLSFYSDLLSPEQITEYINREVKTKLQSLNGVAEAKLMGGKAFSMRIWIDPQRLASVGLDIPQLVAGLRANNAMSSVGSSEGDYVQINISADTDLQTVEDFEDLVLSRTDDRLIRLSDVAQVELGAENPYSEVIHNGKRAVMLSISPTPGANPLDVAKTVKQELPEIQRLMPKGLAVKLIYDVSDYINASIDEVISTLLEAIAIVILVVFLFLGSFRAVLVPLVTIPLSIVGVVFLMQLLGFSINLLTLLALVLAVGLVVDDAIVMVENISRHIEDGQPSLQAALLGAREMAVPIISMTLTLAAVYAPIGFMGGLTGALFKEFAFTLAAAVFISGVVALVLSPMMCAKVLTPSQQSPLQRFIERLFGRIQEAYRGQLHKNLENRAPVLIILFALLAAIPYLWTSSQAELAPTEDQGVLMFSGAAPKSASFAFTQTYSQQIGDKVGSIPETEDYFLINGMPGPNGVFGFQILKPWEQRQRGQMQIQPELQGRLARVAGLQMTSYPMPTLPGSSGGLPIQFVFSGNKTFEELYALGNSLQEKLMASGLFAYADMDLKFDNPLAAISVDRDMANELGLSMETIGQTLALGMSGGYVDRFDRDERSYKVIPQLQADWRNDPELLKDLQIRTDLGELIPLGSVIDINTRAGPESLAQFQQLNAATLSAVMMPGVSMGQALAYVEKLAAEELPQGVGYDWKGESRDYIKEGDSLMLAFVMALVVIFLVLAAQFDSLRDPFIILLTVPMAMAAALVPINLGFSTINIYTQIGLVTLIGLISKQGILMVEFANQLRINKGMSAVEAIIESSTLRLRPILMTASAIIIAVIPLMLASGAGAVGRRDLGTVVFFGMLFGTLLCLYTVPVIYSYMAKQDSK